MPGAELVREPRILPDIADRHDLAALLADFYQRAFADDLIGPVFVDIARMDLPTHLPVICDFWETVLFRTGAYRHNALRPHQRLHIRAGLTPAHFARWLELWTATVDARHHGPVAELAKVQGQRMAGAMCRRITGGDVESLPALGVDDGVVQERMVVGRPQARWGIAGLRSPAKPRVRLTSG